MENPSLDDGNGNGRDPKSGRFVKGWKGGPGNPDGKRAQAWRQAFLRTVTLAHVRAVARTLVRLAEAREPWAVRELLNRCLGRPREEAQPCTPMHTLKKGIQALL